MRVRSVAGEGGADGGGPVPAAWGDEGRQDPSRRAAAHAADFADADQRPVRQVTDAILVAVDAEGAHGSAVGAAAGNRNAAFAQIIELAATVFGGELKDDGMGTARRLRSQR